jgi:cation diffusion facilitator CzcD-associated flavoprotein CzcO
MSDGSDEGLLAAVQSWLVAFEVALGAPNPAAIQELFRPDGHWRDLLVFTWNVQTVSGASDIADTLLACSQGIDAHRFEVDPQRTPPRLATRAGESVIEAIFRFETSRGRASGVLRLRADADDGDVLRAWTLLTALDEIAGHGEAIGTARPTGEVYSRDFHGPNWLDNRRAANAYDDRDPAVLVVGGGQAGLSIAARLTQLGVDALVVDRWPRIGDNWRQRYHALTLHNQVHVNHLPYMPFPPNWPTYIPKDKVANWFEAYAESMEINFWTDTEFVGGDYDEKDERWAVTLKRADGTERRMHPRHVVMATGVSGIPNRPDIPGLENFAGTVLHASEFDDGADWADREAIVIGTGNSGHDIAQDLQAHGARVTMVQRSPTLIVSVEPSAQIPYALYEEGPSLEDCDLIVAAMPLALQRKTHQIITAQSRELDKNLLAGLERVGFKLDFGRDGTGWQFKYLERGGGYYFNVGCSDLIVSGDIGLVPFDDIQAFTASGAELRGGCVVLADLIVLATGYKGQDVLVRQLFGDAVADRVGPIWGFGPDGKELRNMWVRTGQPGLWFFAGSFAQCRIYSKYLAMQIKAREEGIIPASPPVPLSNKASRL